MTCACCSISREGPLAQLGPRSGRYLSCGAHPQPGGTHALAARLWGAEGGLSTLHARAITAYATHAWLDDSGAARHPLQGLPRPDADQPAAYTWTKAPRLPCEVVEMGAIARQLASGQPLVRDAVARHGGGLPACAGARALELARVVPRMASWLQLLPSGEPYGEVTALPDAGQGIGLSEAVPGALRMALQNAPLQNSEPTPVAVQHIVRSFDPCMVCTVH